MGANYHNTLGLPNELVQAYETKAKNQEEFIYDIFLRKNQLTKSDLVKMFNQLQNKVSESSISRSLSNLQTEGKIFKTSIKKTGDYGVPNSIYQLVPFEEQVEQTIYRRFKMTEDQLFVIHEVFDAFIELSKHNPDYRDLNELAGYIQQSIPSPRKS